MVAHKPIALITGILFFILALVLIVAPSIIFWLFGLTEAVSAEVLARRAGILFSMLGVIFTACALRELPAEIVRILALAMVVGMVGLALLGAIELVLTRVGWGIAAAIAVETVLALMWARLLR